MRENRISAARFFASFTGRIIVFPRLSQADTGTMPEVEIRKPLPLARQVTPVAADSHRKGPTPVAVP
jgi:hypothetical protein